MNGRVEATLDLTNCKSTWEMHQRIQKALQFPDYYGCNWSAFWDCLHIDCPVEYIYILGEHTIPEELKGRLDIIHEILDECREERTRFGGAFGYEVVD